ncbi:cytochrome c [uncultured Bartonella sp.]|uniref:c-type cytochrome n=1 Tax=uncultured Bartonella sp. TaxID=104108 RepID=UPI0025E2CBC4|nr:cytochrome c [uncultured Bartonella sp.]
MKRYFLFASIFFIVILLSIVGYINLRPAINGVAPLSLSGIKRTEIERGAYLARIGDCVACHSKKGKADFSGGEPLLTPFGKITAGNITPDRQTGIGDWSDQDFINAVKYGRSRGGKFLYPAMPYPNFAQASNEDILAIKAYLFTLPPVKASLPKNELKFPFNIRFLVIGWNTLFFKKDGFVPDRQQTDEWNRGAYLVEGLGHCGMCHTPKNIFGADKLDKLYQGAVLQGWYAPEITSDSANGVGAWKNEEVVQYLKTGNNAHAFATGPMGAAVSNSLQHVDEKDLQAIATYLKSVPGSGEIGVKKAMAPDSPELQKGALIFSAHCSACHGVQGEGTKNIAPAFLKPSSIDVRNLTNPVMAVLNGNRATATEKHPTAPTMPSFRNSLSDEDIAAVLNYIRNSWGNSATPIGKDVVFEARKKIRGDG